MPIFRRRSIVSPSSDCSPFGPYTFCPPHTPAAFPFQLSICRWSATDLISLFFPIDATTTLVPPLFSMGGGPPLVSFLFSFLSHLESYFPSWLVSLHCYTPSYVFPIYGPVLLRSSFRAASQYPSGSYIFLSCFFLGPLFAP